MAAVTSSECTHTVSAEDCCFEPVICVQTPRRFWTNLILARMLADVTSWGHMICHRKGEGGCCLVSLHFWYKGWHKIQISNCHVIPTTSWEFECIFPITMKTDQISPPNQPAGQKRRKNRLTLKVAGNGVCGSCSIAVAAAAGGAVSQ